MKIAIVWAALAACVHHIPLSPVEQCAQENMSVAGVSLSSDTSFAVTTGRAGAAYTRGVSNGESVQCRPPTTTLERCEIDGGLASSQVKLDWGVLWRNAVTAAGYVFVLPGILFSIGFSGEEDDARDEAAATFKQTTTTCLQKNMRPATTIEPGEQSDDSHPVNWPAE